MILDPAILSSFQRFFPLTIHLLGAGSSGICRDYLSEMELPKISEAADLRYFAGFVRQRFLENKNLTIVAQWEWIQAWLTNTDFSFSSRSDEGCVEIHPSLQILRVPERNETLQRDQGLYGFIFNEQQNKVIEVSLDLLQAQIIDLLSEDRKFRPEQLIAMAMESAPTSPVATLEEWQKRYFSLEKSGILRMSSR